MLQKKHPLFITTFAGLMAFFASFADPAATYADAVYVYGGYSPAVVSPSYYYRYDYAAVVPAYAPPHLSVNPVPYHYGYGIAPFVPVSGYAPGPVLYSPYHNVLRYRGYYRY